MNIRRVVFCLLLIVSSTLVTPLSAQGIGYYSCSFQPCTDCGLTTELLPASGIVQAIETCHRVCESYVARYTVQFTEQGHVLGACAPVYVYQTL